MATKFDFLSPGVNIREIDQSFIPAQADALGPIIIGRTRKGPANKPVKVRNLDDYVSVFGLPVAGGNGVQGDIWREGNTVGPTYASYAAQAWLASEESPITVVRIAGEQHSSIDTGGEAGWQVGAAPIGATGHNSTAYGLFLCDEADGGQATAVTLAAGSGFNANTIGDGSGAFTNFKLRVIQGTAGASLHTAATSGAGLKFEVIFNDALESITSISRDATGGSGGVPLITLGMVSSGGTIANVMSQIEAAFDLAISSGDITNVSVANKGSTLEIFNLDTSGPMLVITDFRAGGHIKGTGIEGDGADAVSAQDLDAGDRTKSAGALAATSAVSKGSLAAVFYSVTGALALSGTVVDAGAAGTVAAGTMMESAGASGQFNLVAYDESGAIKDDLAFNLSRNSSNYIRKVFNTNPQLTNTAMYDAADQKTYWLGESFLDHYESNVSGTVAENIYGILLPLGTGLTAGANWGYHRYGAREAKSGWVFSDKSTNEQKLFRFKSLHVGIDIQKDYLIAIEDIKETSNSNVNAFGSFTVCIKSVTGDTVEKYSGCNLNPASPNYVAARIGDQYQVWSDQDKRYRTYGDFKNQSNIFYIEVSDVVENGGASTLLPAGFYGPVRPKGFQILTGDAQYKSFDGSADFTGAAVQSGEDATLFKGHTGTAGQVANLGSLVSAQFEFPKLRMRDNGSDGGASDQARTYWGVRPKVSARSNQHDPDYIDYLRPLGMGLNEADSHIPANSNFEYSFIFSLDDVKGTVASGVWTWASGNYDAGLSFTSIGGQTYGGLLDANVRQFIMPVWGGSEGFDIKEMEPLRNELITDATFSEKANYVDYSISKALDSIADSELVPANLLVAPGLWRRSVTDKMIDISENRRDILSIIDIQGDYRPRVEVNNTAENRLGSVTDAITNLKTRSLNSSYACAFYPSVQIADNLNGSKLVWIPSSVAALGGMARSQAQSDVWFAPAGFNRGGLGSLGGSRGPRVIQARQRLDSKERDLLYEQNINPVATFPNEGVVIFGQKTLQAEDSALDRINVRRLVLDLKAKVGDVAKNLLFDQNLESTWLRFKSQVEPILSSTQARFGLSDYKLVLDSTTTTADLIDRNIMYAKIFIKPARAIEYIVVDFVITKTGADFV